MLRKEITAGAVAEAERLLSEGLDHNTIATSLGVTPYVVGLIAQNVGRTPVSMKSRKSDRRVVNVQRDIDATTIRRIQRMLEVGWLSYSGIAREAGVSLNFVSDVAKGRRAALTLLRPMLNEGEEFLREPIRCGGCRVRISVVPCRVCRASRAQLSQRCSSL